jgi:D-alanyl-D-alanine carboxypeptidase/D-alanyl-D-alanine-endopeptidase (penicillin-binding protein 4)
VDVRLRAALLLVAFFAHAASAQTTPTLDEVIRAATGDERVRRAFWGIRIEEEDGRVLADVNSEKLFVPASDRKLFSAAYIAECHGLDETIPTEVSIAGFVRDGVLRGGLEIRGLGDPSLGGRFRERRDDELMPVVDELRRRGVRRIDGSIVVDVSAFDRETLPHGWKQGYLESYYAAPVDAVAFNENVIGVEASLSRCSAVVTLDPSFPAVKSSTRCGSSDALDLRTDSGNRVVARGAVAREAAVRRQGTLLAVDDPARYLGDALRDLLEREGIAVTGPTTVRTERTKPAKPDITLQSPPIAQLLGVVLESSQNLYTEMLLKRTAIEAGRPATYAAALAGERDFLTRVVGVAPGEFDFVDASGLSEDNLVTPRAHMALLRYLMHPARRGAFLELMESPGGEGTLRNRLKGLENRVFAKTGYVAGVATLSGVALGRDGRVRYFSIMVNHHPGLPAHAREAIDTIVRKLAEGTL